MSLILVVISAVSTFLNAEKRSTDNYKAGIEFKCLSNAAETFVDVDLRLKEKPLAELAESLRVLKEKRDELLKKNPRVSLRYYKSAKNEYDKQKEAKEKRLVKVVSERFKNESKIGSSEIKTAA